MKLPAGPAVAATGEKLPVARFLNRQYRFHVIRSIHAGVSC